MLQRRSGFAGFRLGDGGRLGLAKNEVDSIVAYDGAKASQLVSPAQRFAAEVDDRNSVGQVVVTDRFKADGFQNRLEFIR